MTSDDASLMSGKLIAFHGLALDEVVLEDLNDAIWISDDFCLVISVSVEHELRFIYFFANLIEGQLDVVLFMCHFCDLFYHIEIPRIDQIPLSEVLQAHFRR